MKKTDIMNKRKINTLVKKQKENDNILEKLSDNFFKLFEKTIILAFVSYVFYSKSNIATGTIFIIVTAFYFIGFNVHMTRLYEHIIEWMNINSIMYYSFFKIVIRSIIIVLGIAIFMGFFGYFVVTVSELKLY